MARAWTLFGWLLPIGLLAVSAIAPPRAERPRSTRPVLDRRCSAAWEREAWPATWVHSTVFAAVRAAPDFAAAIESEGDVTGDVSTDGVGSEDATGQSGEPTDACDLQIESVPDIEAREVFFGPSQARRVALTFDDGPSRENTPRILDVLAEHDVRVTFFVLGDRGERMPDLLRDIDAGGHDIGNHSWSHPSFRSLWRSQIRDEVCQTSAAIERAIGKSPALLRPPYGRYAPSALALLGGLGFDVVLWSVDSLDWDEEAPEKIAKTVVSRARPGSIVLLHDRRSVTVHALADIITGLRARGFEIVPVSEMLDRSPYHGAPSQASAPVTLASSIAPAASP